MSFWNDIGNAFATIGKGTVQAGIWSAHALNKVVGIIGITKHILSPNGMAEIVFEIDVEHMSAKQFGEVIVAEYKGGMDDPCVVYKNPPTGLPRIIGHIHGVGKSTVFTPVQSFMKNMGSDVSLSIVDEAGVAAII